MSKQEMKRAGAWSDMTEDEASVIQNARVKHDTGKYEALARLADKQQKRIATLEAQNELLRAVVVSAHAYVNASIYDVDPTSQAYQEWLAYLSKMKDAIDGGAMGEG